MPEMFELKSATIEEFAYSVLVVKREVLATLRAQFALESNDLDSGEHAELGEHVRRIVLALPQNMACCLITELALERVFMDLAMEGSTVGQQFAAQLKEAGDARR